MDIDKKTILAFILIGLIIILTQSDFYRETFFPKSYEADKLKREQYKKRQELMAKQDSLAVLTEKLAQTKEVIPTEKQVEILPSATSGILSQTSDEEERL